MEKEGGYSSTWLGGWSSDGKSKGQRFHFTIQFPSVQMYEHEQFSNGKNLRELMQRFQDTAERWYREFNTKAGGEQ